MRRSVSYLQSNRFAGGHDRFAAHVRFVIETQPHPPARLAHRGRDERPGARTAFRRILWPVGRGGGVVFAEQPPRLRRVGSLLAVCLSLGGLVEDPKACPRRKTVLALQEDRYAHGRAQLAVGHHRDELVSQLDLVEGLDDTVAVVDPTSSGVEKEDHSVQSRPILTQCHAHIVCCASHDRS